MRAIHLHLRPSLYARTRTRKSSEWAIEGTKRDIGVSRPPTEEAMTLLQSQPAIHRQQLPRNEIRACRKEQHRRRNILDRPVALHRRLLRELLISGADLAGRHNHPRRHAVHADLRRPRLR